MTTQDWLKSKVGFNISDLSIEGILLDRDVEYGADASDMTDKQRDLCRADALIIYLSSSNKGSEKWTDGNSSESTASESFTYRDNAQKMAIFWYEKWGELVPDLYNDSVTGSPSNMW